MESTVKCYSSEGDPWISHEHVIAGRDAIAPDGQVLPDWLTWREYSTLTDGVEVRTWSIVRLPQTYYGPSIPLGQGWTFGGLSSPVSAAAQPATVVTASSSGSIPPSPSGPSSSPPFYTFSATSKSLDATATPSTSTSILAPTASAGSSLPVSTTSPASILSPQFPSTRQVQSDTSSSPDPSSAAQASRETDIPLLPALLVPLLALLLISVGALWYFGRRRQALNSQPRLNQPGWLPAYWRKEGRHRYEKTVEKPEPSYAPDGPAEPDGQGDTQSQPTFYGPAPPPLSPVPTERSALLAEFTPHHHRQHSLTPSSRRVHDDELAELVAQNHTLLERLTLGLGLSSSRSSSRCGRPGRATSGNTVERLGSAAYRQLGDGPPVVQTQKSVNRTSQSQSGSATGSGSGNGAQADTSGTTSGPNPPSAGFSDRLLSFRVPASSNSSRGSYRRGGSTSSRASSGGTRSTGDLDGGWFASRYGQTRIAGEATAPAGRFGDPSTWPSAIQEDDTGDTPNDQPPARTNTSWISSSRLGFPQPPPRDEQKAHHAAKVLQRGKRGYSHAPLSAFGSMSPTPPASLESAEPHTGSNRPTSASRSALSPMNDLFVTTPPGSAGSADRPHSFIGEPIVDVRGLAHQTCSNGAFDEFGGPTRKDSRETNITSANSEIGRSENASLQSGYNLDSHGGSQSSGPEEQAAQGQALHGRRSRPWLLSPRDADGHQNQA
ncbi:hypothetical protein BD324DRAFT_484591 [Kockovaella imperatae]|uniref:Uncharacterized protein n=1 Tax=Kockovaella imperatae TaxID=4999 RepID=A0A1Y1UE05_9TREE|nr:hypothetical protein BD324DRAFT_484591 [Kockovaella imperatae]ORX36273.1 hypothetical protein BD324DRAFT_484591 [Kockovaella imperatae]